MLRALLTGVLAVSAIASCKGQSDAPTVAVGAAAGKVVELTGKVEATRDGKTRELAIGGEVFADDQIATTADSTVTIELFHNGARWAVVSNKKSRVDASLAWGLDKQQASKTVDHNSAAAGRNAERSAADTGATAEERKEESMPAAAPVAAAAETGAAPGGGAPPPPAPTSRAEPIRRGKGAPRDRSIDKDDDEAPSKNIAPTKMTAQPQAAVVISPTEVAARQRPALKKCLDSRAPTVTITIMRSQNKTTVSLGGPGNITDNVRSCVDAVVQKVEWPTPSATFEVVLSFD